MRLRSINLGIFLFAQALSAIASGFTPLADIRETAVEAVREQHPISTNPHIRSLTITAAKLDSRLRLAACDKPLTPEFTPNRRSLRLSVKVSCLSPQLWSLYVPVSISAEMDVLTTNASLPRGHMLTLDDFSPATRRMSGGYQNYVHTPEEALGKTLKRSLASGKALTASNLTTPMAIKRGDYVLVEASAGPLTVVASGIAMTNGRIGEQIKIKNTDSDRIISARIINQGTVRVML